MKPITNLLPAGFHWPSGSTDGAGGALNDHTTIMRSRDDGLWHVSINRTDRAPTDAELADIWAEYGPPDVAYDVEDGRALAYCRHMVARRTRSDF